jgi:uncharacterized membrane protein YoaK (UPF0700 family)
MGFRRQERSERQLSRERSWIAPALAAIAGCVDAIGYMLLYHIFTSHMSGNTVAMTMPLATGNWPDFWRHFQPIVAFFAGIIVGLSLTDAFKHVKVDRIFAGVAGCELVLLVAFVALAHPAHQWMVFLPATAMGIQNAMLRRVGHHKVRTTFVTGMLTNTAQGLVDATVSCLTRDGKAKERFADFMFYGAIWSCFATGGVIGALLEHRFESFALILPIAGLTTLIIFDIIAPLSDPKAEDEQT